MHQRQILNSIIMVAVVVLVGGVAWYKSQRLPANGALPATGTPSADRAGLANTAPSSPPTAAAVPVPATPAPATRPSEKLPRLVDLGSDKCIPCKKLAPILDELRVEFKGRISVEFIDVWKNPAAGKPYAFRVIPTQILYDRDGKEVWRHEGFISKENLIAKFAEVGVK